MAEQTSDLVNPRLARTHEPLQATELAGCLLLAGVAPESVFGLLSHCDVLEVPPGTTLISPKASERCLYLVLRGALAAYLESSTDEPVARITAGQSVGEVTVIDARSVWSHVVALEPSRLLAVDETTFWRLIMVSHAFAANVLHVLAQRLRASSAQLMESVERGRWLERAAMTDALTGLHNRRWLEQRLARLIARHERSSRLLSVVLLDIDHFKRVNDEFGHLAGDDVLAAVGECVQASIRPTDLAVRHGGEEFLLVLPDTGGKGARLAAERLRAAIAAIRLPEVDRRITVSAGIATLEANDTEHTLVERADRKLYEAKTRGRDRVES